MIDILERLDEEIDRTPPEAYTCRPLPRTVVAAAAAEIRRLRVDVARLKSHLEELTNTRAL